MTEKQREAQAEAKKLRLYTAAFVVVIALLVAFAAITAVTNSGMIERGTTAVTVDDTKVSAVELNYYYIDSINSYLEQWGDYIALTGLDTTKALDEQFVDTDQTTTWADYFLDQATANIHTVYSIYNEAVAAGYTLSDADALSIESNISTTELYAMYYYGYADLDSYLVAMYGAGANEETYRAYAEVQYVASAYANDHYDSLTYTDEQLAAALAEDPKAYTYYSYNYFYVAASDFLKGGTVGEDGSVTYTNEEKDAAVNAAKEAAESLLSQNITTDVLLDKAINALNIKENAASTAIKNYYSSSVSTVMRDWVTADERQAGDLTVIPYETTTTDADGNKTTVTNGYYVVLFNEANDNDYLMNNVRHLLVAFTGGTTENGTTTYSDEEKAKAKSEAENLLAQYLDGEKTEEAFTALLREHTDDIGSDGTANNDGLYENIHLTSGYVENFLNWANDASRTVGETGIIETEYGYHIMYYVGKSEQTYLDSMITSTLRDEDMTAWESDLMESSTMTVKNTGKVKTDLKLSSGT